MNFDKLRPSEFVFCGTKAHVLTVFFFFFRIEIFDFKNVSESTETDTFVPKTYSGCRISRRLRLSFGNHLLLEIFQKIGCPF